MSETADPVLERLLGVETIAVVGCSRSPGKAAHAVPAYLQRQGYDVIPVNPFADEILGKPAYDSLADVPDHVELVNVFRPAAAIPDVIDQVLDRLDRVGDVEAVWLQLGISHDEAAERAERAGLEVVQDRCIKVEHGRLCG
jgi:hypothetical protein